MADVMAALERARTAEQEVSAGVQQVEILRRIASRTCNSHAYTMETLDKLNKLERELNKQIDRMADAKLEALEYISILEGEERGVIERYYMLGRKWEKIAMEMYMSDRRVFLLRKSAIAKMRAKFQGTESRRDYGNRKESSVHA